jgi:membrane-associated phospholipid phosphatase
MEEVQENFIENSDDVSIVTKILANLFSYLFHPLFIPLYLTLFLLYIHPSAFAGFSAFEKKQTAFIVALNLLFFPLMSVLLLKAVGFIDSLFLKTQKDRIIPFIACGIFFFWAYTVFKEQPKYPRILVSYIFGIFLASSAALLANIYFKVSMHAIGVGGLLGSFFILFYTSSMQMTWPLCAVLLITGLACTSRLILKAHRPFDIYGGLLIGIISQLAAAYIV